MTSSSRKLATVIVTLALTAPGHAALVDSGWALQSGSNATLSGRTAGAATATGTNIDAGLFTAFDAVGTSYTLTAIGDAITVTGSLFIDGTLAGVNSHPGSIRFGLYDVNGKPDTTGWLGYSGLLDTTGTAGTSGGLYKRNTVNTGNFYSGTGAMRLTTYDGLQYAFVAGTTYDFSMALTKTAAGVQIDARATNAADGSQVFLNSTATDTTPNTTSFNRFGACVSNSGGGLGAETFTLSNVAVTFAAVPEPSVYGLVGAGALATATLVRRRKTGRE